MSLTQEQKESIGSFIISYQWYIGLGIGILASLITSLLTQAWIFLFITSALAGLIMNRAKAGVLAGALSVFFTFLIFLLYRIFTGPALAVLDLFIGLVGLSGFGWLVFIIILILGFLIGASGGFLGASVSELVPWPIWVQSKPNDEDEENRTPNEDESN
ncbi:MAG: hypothetical protein ACW99Q_29020 [Candidatus Kariarchaeaceae archaeon]